MSAVLEFSFLPKPDNNAIRVDTESTLTWIAGRNTESHNVYFGTSNPPALAANTAVTNYSPGILEPNTVYYWCVDLSNDAGHTEGDIWQFSVESSGYYWEHFLQDENGLICMEAEDFSKNVTIGDHAWELITEPGGYSGDGSMQVLPDDGYFTNFKYSERCSHLDYAVRFVQSGIHYLWIRGCSQNNNDNVFHAGLNDEESYDSYKIGNFENQNQWEWLNRAATVQGDRRVLNVKALGVQVLNLYFGKDGCIADKIVITSDPDYVPAGLGPDVTVDVSKPGHTQHESSFRLYQNYPNPFNPSTEIRYQISDVSTVLLTMHNTLGEEVGTLVDDVKQAGEHSIVWHADEEGAGVYFARLSSGNHSKTIKLVLLK